MSVRTMPVLPGLIVLLVSAHAGAETLSIDEFLAKKATWPSLIDKSITLEGRHSVVSRIQQILKFKNCDLVFHFPDGVPEFSRLTKNLEVTGRLQRRDGELCFVVERCREVFSDVEQLQKMRSALVNPKPDDYYNLAAWAFRRGRFYEDDELLALAADMNQRGVLVARRLLPEGDAQARLQLAKKVADLHLSDALRMALIHEGLRLTWSELQKQNADAAKQRAFAQRLADQLPGAKDRFPKTFPQLQITRYRKEPIAAYEAAAPEVRRKLHRLFYAEVLLSAIQTDAAARKLPGSKVAELITAELPELDSLAAEYREDEFQERVQNATGATRSEMQEVVRILEERKQLKTARQVKQEWLKARETRLRRDGPEGLMQAADDYIDLLDEKEKAAELLIEADALSPDQELITSRLARLGYEKHHGNWLTKDEAKRRPKSDLEKSMAVGRPKVGMTTEDLRRALGTPDSIARMATRHGIASVWVYGTEFTVYLERPNTRVLAKVVAVSEH